MLAAGVDGGGVVRRDDNGRIPVGGMHGIAEHLFGHRFPPRVPVASIADCTGGVAGADVLYLPGAGVVALEAQELR